jgi:hypothetical protein
MRQITRVLARDALAQLSFKTSILERANWLYILDSSTPAVLSLIHEARQR